MIDNMFLYLKQTNKQTNKQNEEEEETHTHTILKRSLETWNEINFLRTWHVDEISLQDAVVLMMMMMMMMMMMSS